jgi:hypothetical protein
VLDGWKLCDTRTCCTLPDVRVPAGSYVVITRDTAALREARAIPERAVLVQAAVPSLNNTTDVVALFTADSTLVDSIAYSMSWGVKGISLERTSLEEAPSQMVPWAASYARDSATCGALNSRIRLAQDVRISAVTCNAQDRTVEVRVENAGLERSGSRAVVIESNGRQCLRERTSILEPLDVQRFAIDVDALAPTPGMRGPVRVLCWLTTQDDRSANDTAELVVHVPYQASDLTITEVLFDPAEQQCDFVEVFNATTDTIALQNWWLVDGGNDVLRITHPVFVLPRSYLAIGVDSAIIRMTLDSVRAHAYVQRSSWNLNSSGDHVTLCNPSGFIVDAAAVDATLHADGLPSRRGVSLEKRSVALSGLQPLAWSSSTDQRGCTPARSNAVELRVAAEGEVTVRPHPFVRRHADVCLITFTPPLQRCIATVRIRTPEGRHVRMLLDAVWMGREGAAAWDGTDDDGEKCDAGPYVVVIETVDPSGTDSWRTIGLCVVTD